MNRKDTTEFLSDLLISNRLVGQGKYYAREVCLDYGTSKLYQTVLEIVKKGGV